MSEERKLSIVYSSSLDQLTEINSSFDRGVLRVAYTGKNRNNSFISKDTFEKCIPTIFNCPIVCNYDRENEEIGSHDIDIITDTDGETRIVNITQPLGVVPESANYWWEEIQDESGIHEYLCIDVIIWKRQEAYKKIKENGITDESMEITVNRGKMSNGIYVISDFVFTAFCLLGTAEPCFESASLQMFALDTMKSEYSQMMDELKACFSQVQHSFEVDIHTTNHSEGGETLLENRMELLSKYGLTLEDLDFDLETAEEDGLEEKFQTIKDAKESNGGAAFSLTAEQFKEELLAALYALTIESEWGSMPRYIYVDYDTTLSEVYCYDMMDWRLYGFPYSMNGDNVSVDFENGKRKKCSIVDFDEGDADFTYKHLFEAVANSATAAKAAQLDAKYAIEKAELEEKFNAASGTIESIAAELETLRQFKVSTEKSERESAEEAVFERFKELEGNEDFINLRSSCSSMTIDEIEEKCFAIHGRTTMNFSTAKVKAPKLRVGDTGDKNEPYGGLFVEFPVNQ